MIRTKDLYFEQLTVGQPDEDSTSQAEYERICSVEREAETLYWQERTAYTQGYAAYTGIYAPPAWDAPGYDDYIRGYNDAWAAVKNIRWFRR